MGEVALHAAPLVFNGISLGAEHFDTIWDPAKHKWKKVRGLSPAEDPALLDSRTMEEKGYVLRRRCDVAPDEEIVATVRHRGEVLPRRPASRREPPRRSSAGDMRRAGLGAAAGGGAAGALVPYRDDRQRDDASDSEASIPPRSRARAKSTSSRSKTSRYRRRSSSSSSSASSLGSSTDEEKQIRKMKHKKWITATLASVATIHAAQKVYSSIENHDKRIREVERGTLSPQSAAKKQSSARWQDAAAIGIAALGIRGAISEWKEVSEEHAHHKELMQVKEEHHKKRVEHERRRRARQQNGYYKGRDGKWYYDGPEPQSLSSGSYRSASRYDGRTSDNNSRRLKSIDYEDRSTRTGGYDRDDDDDYDDRDNRRHRDRDRSRARSSRARSRAGSLISH
ncbi:hypothetical protein DV736_g1110, partial [Chaetothyriales sp. CBS 134916]